MRRTAKMLALLLTLVMILGAFAIIANAAADDYEVKGNGITNITQGGTSLTFDGKAFDAYVYKDADGTIKTTSTSDVTGEAGLKTDGAGHLSAKQDPVTGNYYGEFYGDIDQVDHPGSYKGTTYWDMAFLRQINQNKADATFNTDFITMDFDLASKFYVDKLAAGGREAEKGYLGYSSCAFNVNFRGVANSYKNGAGAHTLDLFYSADEGCWMLGIRGTDFDAKLSNEAGVWNHITLVYEIDNTVEYSDGTVGEYVEARKAEVVKLNIYNSKLHYYVNGEHIGSLETGALFTTNDIDYSNPSQYTTTFGTLVPYNIRMNAYDHNRDFSIMYDNWVAQAYAKGYEGDLANHDFTQPIYNCDDVVFNGGYIFEGPNQPVAAVNGNKYFIQAGATSAIDKLVAAGNNDIQVELFADFEGTYEVNGPMTVTTNGFTFNTTSEDYGRNESDGVIIFEEGSKASIYWDEGGLFDNYSEVTVGSVPTYPGESVIYVDGTFYKLLGWSDEEDGEVIDIEAIEEVDEYWFYAVYEEIAGAYIIGEKAYETFETYVSDIAAMTDGDTIELISAPTETVIVNAAIEVITNGNEFKFASAYFTADESDGTLTFREAEESEIFNVSWLNANGEVLATEKYTNGSKPFGHDPSNVGKVKASRWHDVGFDHWEEVTVDGADVEIAPVMGKVYPAEKIEGVKFNVDMAIRTPLYIYIPVDVPTNDENVQITLNATGGGYKDWLKNNQSGHWSATNYTIDGVPYIRAVLGFNNYNNVDAVSTVTLKVTINGVTQNYTFKVSVMNYYQAVMNSDTSDAGKRLIMDTARLHQALRASTNMANVKDLDTLLATPEYTKYLTNIDYEAMKQTFTSEQLNVDYMETLAPYISDIQFGWTMTVPSFRLTEKAGANIKSILASYSALDGTGAEKSFNITSKESNTNVWVNNNYQVSSFYFANSVRFTVYFNDGTKVTGTYSAAAYINGLEAQGSDSTIARMYYAHLQSALAYKISE